MAVYVSGKQAVFYYFPPSSINNKGEAGKIVVEKIAAIV